MTNSNGIILLVTGPISTVSSIIIIIMVLRSKVKLSSTYHRLMFGISLTDIILSAGLSCSSLPAPIGTPGIWKALGTQSTCNAQGICIMFGTGAAPFYFLSLQIYYLCRIKYRTSSENMRKMEPCLHGAPIMVGLVSAFVPFVTESMNPGTRGYCWLQDFPLHCTTNQDVECIRGMTTHIQRQILLVIPFTVSSILNVIIMWNIYTSTKKQHSIDALHNFDSSDMHDDEMQRQSTSGTLRKGSLIHSPEEILKTQYHIKGQKAWNRIKQYFVAYFLTYAFLSIDGILHNVQSINNLLEILVMIFYPLWGFFNLVVFILPVVKKVQEKDVEIYFPQACVTAIKAYGGASVDSRALRTTSGVSIAARALHDSKSTKESTADISSSNNIENNPGLI